MSGIKLHERTLIVRKAGLAIREAIGAEVDAALLTPGEVVSILLEAAQEWSKYVLRMERHGNYDKKADEA